jgi:CubicO group peptidase (beta-lactamase class C family)
MTNETWRIPSDAAIRDLLAERIDAERNGIGIVVGVIDAEGRRVIARGALAKSDPRALDGETVFEIGSITKVFTCLALADMAERGEVALNDPVAKHLPAGVSVPERGGKPITLIDLATHTSGLPRWPDDIAPGELTPKDWSNPYADYTAEQLQAFLAGYRLRRDIGAAHAYSNLGMGLLGRALAHRAGVDFETLVRQRITGPLGMADTAIALTPDQEARFATAHDHARRPVEAWQLPTFAGAGALRSTADDMLTFLAAELGFIETALKAAERGRLHPDPGLAYRFRSGGRDRLAWRRDRRLSLFCSVRARAPRRGGDADQLRLGAERRHPVPSAQRPAAETRAARTRRHRPGRRGATAAGRPLQLLGDAVHRCDARGRSPVRPAYRPVALRGLSRKPDRGLLADRPGANALRDWRGWLRRPASCSARTAAISRLRASSP